MYNPIENVLSNNTLKFRLATGTIWNFIATIFNQGSIFASNLIIARIIGKHDYGEYSIVISTITMFTVLLQLSMGYTATKFIAEFRSVNKPKTERILGLCFVVTLFAAVTGTIIMILCSNLLATHALKAPHLTGVLMVGAGHLFFSTINGFQVGVFSGLEGYKRLAQAAVFSGIITVIGIALAAWWLQLYGALIGLSTTALLRCWFHNIWLRKELHENQLTISYKNYRQEINIISKFAIPAAISGYVTIPSMWLGNTFLIRQIDGFEQMALYNAALSIRLCVMFIPMVANNVCMSILNNHRGRRDSSMYWKTFRVNLVINIFAIIFIGSILLYIGPELFKIFGNDFKDAFPVLKLLLVAALLEGTAMTVYQIVQSQGIIWQSLFLIAIPYCLFFVITAYYFTGSHGSIGLALAYATGWGINLIATSCLAIRISIRNPI